MTKDMVREGVGYGLWPALFRDPVFYLALSAGIIVWGVSWFTVVPTFTADSSTIARILVFTVIWYPIIEETFFRGIVQTHLIDQSWGSARLAGFSLANWITSLLFMLAHIWVQPVSWAMLVIVPSMVYGYFRDRYDSVFPSIVLHSFYNLGFVGINYLAQ